MIGCMKKMMCVLVLGSTLLASCAGGGDAPGNDAATTATSAGAAGASAARTPEFDGGHVSPAEFAAAVDGGATVLDVRTPEEYREGHIPGALLLDVNADDFDALAGHLKEDADYAVYCRSGARSREAIERLRDAGIRRTVGLDGGMNAWPGDVIPGEPS
ncbi:rhodanese-like domain-containing protein [Corynebacterium pygosceleis]|uniref:rhodanese-like domain-containing protein n=1 Tax=Corynebacterium pygosceleis TaxID=2800406 RepID=UPI001903A715|nr:rhodanese-like domain-containing protein [Corynebacterium pygosceleis]MCK7674227.1 rhodanese-like domain-containing protein [Corynebacterium pygosceleis]MCL0120473.1 rhodanese-like domain-containing protein [Corynebacterium pygosceleis]